MVCVTMLTISQGWNCQSAYMDHTVNSHRVYLDLGAGLIVLGTLSLCHCGISFWIEVHHVPGTTGESCQMVGSKAELVGTITALCLCGTEDCWTI